MFKYFFCCFLLFAAAFSNGGQYLCAQKPGGTVTGPKPVVKSKAKPQTKPKQKPKSTRYPLSLTRTSSYIKFSYGPYSYNLLFVAGGTFTMGATQEQGDYATPNEYPAHDVTLSSYYMGETEVPQWLWTAVMGNNPSYNKGDNLPVESVSYDDCKDFIARLNSKFDKNFSLPTEAQWEYAARGGNLSNGYNYSGSNDLNTVAWNAENSGDKTHPVALKQANELGLYDMSGNVAEWCSDWYEKYGSGSGFGPLNNPTGAGSGSDRVYRGGSYPKYGWICCVSHREAAIPGATYLDLGFRLAFVL